MAKPSCLMMQGNERLSNHCLLETVKGKLVDEQTMQLVVSRLKREGYFGGLKTTSFKGTLYPDIYYSSNINGGNPNKPLILGNVEFESNPVLNAKEGFVIGFNASGSGRKAIDIGRYLDGSARISYGHSVDHNLSIKSAKLNFCSKNRLKGLFYADFCISGAEVNKEITRDSSQSIKASVSKLNLLNMGAFNEARLSVIRLDTEDFAQNQVELSVDTIQRNNLATSFRVKFGQELTHQLAMNYGIAMSATTTFAGHKFNFELNHELNDGGILFGVNQSDRTTHFAASTNLNSSTTIAVGYWDRDSSIDYFDESYPTLRLTKTVWLQ